MGAAASQLIQKPSVHRALAVAAVAWLAFGIYGFWPVALVECDGPIVAVASDALAVDSPVGAAISYNQEGTPGSYAVLTVASRWTGVPAWTWFAILSGLAAVVFLLGGTRLISREMQVPWPVCALLLLSFQETLAAGDYPNTNGLSAGAFGAALLLAHAQAGWRAIGLSAVLFGIAGWLRADMALMALVFPVLFWGAGTRQRNVARMAVHGAIAGVTALGLVYASGSSLSRIFAKLDVVVNSWNGTSHGFIEILQSRQVINHVAFVLVAHVFLLGLGVVVFVRQRQWRLLLLTIAGVGPLWYLYGPSEQTPKELQYLIPFLALPVMQGVLWLVERFRAGRRWPALAVAVAAALQLLVGVRVVFAHKPWAADPGPTFAVAWSRTLPPGKAITKASVVLGAGLVMPTPDGPRLSSGIFWAPLMWRQQKLARVAVTDDLRDLFARLPAGSQTLAWTNNCNADAASRLALSAAGYHCTGFGRAEGARRMTWKDDSREVHVAQVDFSDYGLNHFSQWRGRTGLYIYASGREARRVREQAPAARLITGFEDLDPLGVFELTMPDVATPASP